MVQQKCGMIHNIFLANKLLFIEKMKKMKKKLQKYKLLYIFPQKNKLIKKIVILKYRIKNTTKSIQENKLVTKTNKKLKLFSIILYLHYVLNLYH